MGCSTFSKNSYVTIVLNVLNIPALIPLGGSSVTLIVFYRSPKGNLGCYSHVIQSLKSSWITASGVIIVSISSMNFKPRWQFWRIHQFPDSNPALMTFLATSSYPSPIETFSQNTFLLFLESSSIEDVGSAPADSK